MRRRSPSKLGSSLLAAWAGTAGRSGEWVCDADAADNLVPRDWVNALHVITLSEGEKPEANSEGATAVVRDAISAGGSVAATRSRW